MQIWLLKDEGDFDIGLTAYRTKKAARAALISLIKERWEDEMGDLDIEMPTCPNQLIEEWAEYNYWNDNDLIIEEVTLKD